MASIPQYFQINSLVRKLLHFYQNLSGTGSFLEFVLKIMKTLYEIFWGSHLEHDSHGYTVVQIS